MEVDVRHKGFECGDSERAVLIDLYNSIEGKGIAD
jgi:hypothetical protein